MKNRFFAFLLCVSMLISLAACDGPGKNNPDKTTDVNKTVETVKKPIVIKFANYFPETHAMNLACINFKKIVEKESNGELTVEIYANNSLGSEKEFVEGVSMGSIQMCLMGSLLADRLPATKVVEIPFLFDNLDQAIEIMSNERIFKIFEEDFATVGLKHMGTAFHGARCFGNSVKEIHTPEEAAKLKIRVPNVSHFLDFLSAFGYKCIAMAMSEVFSALQNHAVDGNEQTLALEYSTGVYEVQPYIGLTNHTYSFNQLEVNAKWFDGLSAERQTIITNACAALLKEGSEACVRQDKEVVSLLKKAGNACYEVDMTPFKENCVPVYEEYYKNADFAEICDIIKSLGGLSLMK